MIADEGTSLRPLILLAAATAAVMFVFPLCVRFPLVDPDEGLHAAIAQEMVERGHWLTPSLLGKPFWDKPIFYCWIQAASLRMLGPSEAAVRLPGLMFGLLGAVTTGLLGWRLTAVPLLRRSSAECGPLPGTAGKQAVAHGLIAGILYATTILPTALAQAASHDVALVPWINLTLLLLWEAERGQAPFAGTARRRAPTPALVVAQKVPVPFSAVRGRLFARGGRDARLVDPHQGPLRRGRGRRGLWRLSIVRTVFKRFSPRWRQGSGQRVPAGYLRALSRHSSRGALVSRRTVARP